METCRSGSSSVCLDYWMKSFSKVLTAHHMIEEFSSLLLEKIEFVFQAFDPTCNEHVMTKVGCGQEVVPELLVKETDGGVIEDNVSQFNMVEGDVGSGRG